MRHSMLYHY